ncbi:hypothetical protein ACHHYP_12296 [Achlya hypogyna]|uniref:Transmembrane protein n=1 Tax=Achlya hypogyna TaxID=1202772 RepID=A0A1V9YHE7_ACHHY|nr:hypothetical protein ACHHYP_12296 [Achlya hypogyna]
MMSTPVTAIGPTSYGVQIKRSHARLSPWVQRLDVLVGIVVILLVAIDSVANNWAINDYVGDGYTFLTPIAKVTHASDLAAQYRFARGGSLDDISNIGFWMVNFSVNAMVTKSNDVYVASVGSFPLTTAMDQCAIFKATYPFDVGATPTARLAIASNTVSFYRGNALTHLFTGDRDTNLGNTSMTSAQLNALGYTAGRTGTDMRLTTGITVANTSAPQQLTISFFKIFPKSFCTGCNPATELGFGQCKVTFTYNDSAKVAIVSSSTNVLGSMYKVGALLPQSGFSSASHYVKFIAIAVAVSGFLAGRRTAQWTEVDTVATTSLLAKTIRTVMPKYFPYPSKALRFDMFTYNSDIFVFLFSAGVLLDMQNCLLFLRVMNLFNSLSPTFAYTIQTYALTTRLLWINCTILKVLKLTWHLLTTATFNGESRIMGYLNLTSVTSLYASAILLTYVPPYIEYTNSVTLDLNHKIENLDTVHVAAFDSFYLRAMPAVIVLILVNIFVITALDHLIHYRNWQLLAKNSLARQAIFNSSSILCDFLHGVEIETETDGNGALLVCKARRLSTLQWFFLNHLTCFGLPEKDLKTRKRSAQTNAAQHLASTTEDSATGKCLVVQDGDHHVHLIDATFVDITPLVYNIKMASRVETIGPTFSAVVVFKNNFSSSSKAVRFAVLLLGIAVTVLVVIDAFTNNWALNDYIGNAQCFVTPIANTPHASDVAAQYAFPPSKDLSTLSQVGLWMLNYTIGEFVGKKDSYYVVSAGSYEMTGAIDRCSMFTGTYAVVTGTNVKVGVVSNSITYIHGNAISHTFTSEPPVAPSGMSSTALTALGYTPTRLAVDLRLTDPFSLANTTAPQNFLVTYYRLYSESFCTGCKTVSEMGFGTCNWTVVYNDATGLASVTASDNILGTTYKLGIMLPQSIASSAAHYLKAIAIAYAILGYLASRRTVQWKDVDVNRSESLVSKVIRALTPKYFAHSSYALQFDMFSYNSDFVVFLFSISTILDLGNWLLYVRSVEEYNIHAPNAWYTLQLFALNIRLLWVNCAILKGAKILWSVVSTASHCGDSRVMGWLNLRSVVSLYLSTIALVYVPQYIDYNNSVVYEIYSTDELLDPIHVNALEGYYLRCLPALGTLLVANVAMVTILDHVWNVKYWRFVTKNSLARQAIFNSSSILCDYLDGIEPDVLEPDSHGTVIHCKARRLSTLQWYFMSHLVLFGLPEKELRARKRLMQTTTNLSTASGLEVSKSVKCIIVQDTDHHVHLIDANFADVTALVYNIKVLKDATIAIQ